MTYSSVKQHLKNLIRCEDRWEEYDHTKGNLKSWKEGETIEVLHYWRTMPKIKVQSEWEEEKQVTEEQNGHSKSGEGLFIINVTV